MDVDVPVYHSFPFLFNWSQAAYWSWEEGDTLFYATGMHSAEFMSLKTCCRYSQRFMGVPEGSPQFLLVTGAPVGGYTTTCRFTAGRGY